MNSGVCEVRVYEAKVEHSLVSLFSNVGGAW